MSVEMVPHKTYPSLLLSLEVIDPNISLHCKRVGETYRALPAGLGLHSTFTYKALHEEIHKP